MIGRIEPQKYLVGQLMEAGVPIDEGALKIFGMEGQTAGTPIAEVADDKTSH